MEGIITNTEFRKFASFYKNNPNSIEIPVKSTVVTFVKELLSIWRYVNCELFSKLKMEASVKQLLPIATWVSAFAFLIDNSFVSLNESLPIVKDSRAEQSTINKRNIKYLQDQ